MKVLVIGAGVIGLTTAVTLAEQGHELLVQTIEPPERTTSAAAGALWGPWQAKPRDRVLRWAADSLGTLTALAGQPGTGVRLVSGMNVSRARRVRPDWLALLPDARPCKKAELPDGYTSGVRYTAPLVDMPVHITYLIERLYQAGGTIEHSRVRHLEQAARIAPAAVNCAGTGARTLLTDPRLKPVRGQQVVVTNPGITEFLEADTADPTALIGIYPHGDHVVLGGTAEPGVWIREPDLDTAEDIIDRCAAVQPLLERAKIIEHQVGLRPGRPEVRLEQDTSGVNAKVIHNYGHGNAGVSLAWGCAKEVLELIGVADPNEPEDLEYRPGF